MSLWWSWRRKQDDGKKDKQQPTELRIATSGSFSIRAMIETLRVDGAGSYSQAGRVRAALFVPSTCTTVQFHGDNVKKPSSNARSSCVHALQMFTPAETASILEDAIRIGASIGWSDRGVSLPTQDVLVQNLSKESQDLVHKAIREQLLPFARRQYPHLNTAFDKQPYPRPGNLFIVRYSAASGRPGGRGLKLHKDETALTFNMCLSPQDGFEGGGTYFPAASADVDGILLRPTPGYCLVHDGNIRHAGNDVISGDRFILVGFYNADGRDRAGEEAFFSKKALDEARQNLLTAPPPPVQTIYFTTAVAANRTGGAAGLPLESWEAEAEASGGAGGSGSGSGSYVSPHRPSPSGAGAGATSLFGSAAERRPLSSVAIQGPSIGEDRMLAHAASSATAAEGRPRPSSAMPDAGGGSSGRRDEADPGAKRERRPSADAATRCGDEAPRGEMVRRPVEPRQQGWVSDGSAVAAPTGAAPVANAAAAAGAAANAAADASRIEVPRTPSTPETQRQGHAPAARGMGPGISAGAASAAAAYPSAPLTPNGVLSGSGGGSISSRAPPHAPTSAAHVRGPRGSATISCMPNWAVFNLLHSKSRPRQ